MWPLKQCPSFLFAIGTRVHLPPACSYQRNICRIALDTFRRRWFHFDVWEFLSIIDKSYRNDILRMSFVESEDSCINRSQNEIIRKDPRRSSHDLRSTDEKSSFAETRKNCNHKPNQKETTPAYLLIDHISEKKTNAGCETFPNSKTWHSIKVFVVQEAEAATRRRGATRKIKN